MNINEFRIFNLKRYSLVGTILYDIVIEPPEVCFLGTLKGTLFENFLLPIQVF